MKIALIGYGKMGHMIEGIARERGHEIVATIDIDNLSDFEGAAFASADVAIEFTSPASAWANVQRAWAAGVKVVCGSTGWIDQHRAEVAEACGEKGKTLFWASNFSVGVAVFRAVNKYLAGIMNGFPQYDVRVDETHHTHKLDWPSGTAITLAEEVVAGLERKSQWAKGTLRIEKEEPSCTHCAESQERIPAPHSVVVNSERRGEVPGTHVITYDSPADSIIITHEAHSRAGFALGAVLAAEYAASHEGLLTIDQMFSF